MLDKNLTSDAEGPLVHHSHLLLCDGLGKVVPLEQADEDDALRGSKLYLVQMVAMFCKLTCKLRNVVLH